MKQKTRVPQSVDEVAGFLEGWPFVGVTRAAEILGIKAPNFRRDAAPHLHAITVEGSASVYLRADVERLRDGRAAARAERNGDG